MRTIPYFPNTTLSWTRFWFFLFMWTPCAIKIPKWCRHGKWWSMPNKKPLSKTLSPPTSSNWWNPISIFREIWVESFIEFCFLSLSLQTQDKFVFKPNDPTSKTKLDVEFRFIQGTYKSLNWLLIAWAFLLILHMHDFDCVIFFGSNGKYFRS